MTRLALPQVTLVCVDTRTPALALAAIAQCTDQIDFGAVKLFTAPGLDLALPPGVQALPIQIDSVAAYSEFMLRGLDRHVDTTHCLVVQWDGYVLDAGQWTDEFLQWDYLGAPLRHEPAERAVGNGGFSLRSKRLLQALQDPALDIHHPEDTCICHANRARLAAAHGIRIAPLALAKRFAFERLAPDGPTFGFHGLFNLHRVMAPEALHQLVAGLPDALARGLDAHDLCRSLIRQGQLATARLLIDKRRRLGMNDRRTWRLRGHWIWARLRGHAS